MACEQVSRAMPTGSNGDFGYMEKYVIGVDFGTLSARAVIVDTANGRELAASECTYAHGILGEADISGERTAAATALQHPSDYKDALSATVRDVLLKSGVRRESVVGLCIDCTASTPLPYLDDGTPLALTEDLGRDPEAYIKLWKHHGAEQEAEKMTDIARLGGDARLSDYGGAISAEWLFPKIAEMIRKSPAVYERADVIAEAAEWLTEIITGERKRSACFAGYKSLWSAERGYPSPEYLAKIDPALPDALAKLRGEVLPLGGVAGYLSAEGERLTGLAVGTAVATPVIDAHAALPAAGVTRCGELMISFGTSACHIVLSDKDAPIPGICGKVMGGVIPGLYAYEAGQPCVGDMLGWFVSRCLPAEYTSEAARLGISSFDYLNRLAEGLEVGASGLVALDWWNGNRSPYVDYELSGLILGLTLNTRPEEIYHALISSIAFGTKRLIELYKTGGIEINRIVAAGGIPQKNKFFMQVMADVLGAEISVAKTRQAGAKGSAIYAAVAAGCYPTVGEAARAMADDCTATYSPVPERTEKYAALYEVYLQLSEHFAASDIMKRLRRK